ncbi:MAG TPA: hypothetical protein VIM61_11225 [Chthoniobacterales bacterium]
MPSIWRSFLGCLFAAVAAASAQTTWTANPVADTFVTTGPSNDLTTKNYGALGALEISGSAASRAGSGFRGIFDTAIRFDLAAAKATFDAAYGAGMWQVQSISLQLATTTASGNAMFNTNSTGQFSIIWMQNDSWAEGTGATPADGLTYATLPGFLSGADQNVGTFTFDTTVGGADGALSVYTLSPGSGLTSDVLSGDLASFELLAATSGVSYLVNSSTFGTASRRPLLSITAVAVPEPAMWSSLAIGLLALGAYQRWHRRRGSLAG